MNIRKIFLVDEAFARDCTELSRPQFCTGSALSWIAHRLMVKIIFIALSLASHEGHLNMVKDSHLN